ncbi:Hypothetical predicted protein [Xyrichtys novacula]|uniref:Uncharacterized protein n=1 Tax=Xyrichtys novacula TaxID=13765 RepID=A0AAV1H182_XYRNO|nr:Hypothetical predicted protein [Xyrichtys novacula]
MSRSSCADVKVSKQKRETLPVQSFSASHATNTLLTYLLLLLEARIKMASPQRSGLAVLSPLAPVGELQNQSGAP